MGNIIIFLTNSTGKYDIPYLTPHAKINKRLIKNLKLILLEEHIGENLCDIDLHIFFLDITPKV